MPLFVKEPHVQPQCFYGSLARSGRGLSLLAPSRSALDVRRARPARWLRVRAETYEGGTAYSFVRIDESCRQHIRVSVIL